MLTLDFTCCSVTPPFSFRVPSAVFSQPLLQLSSLVFWQRAFPVWSSHLFPAIIRCTEQQSPLKTTPVASSPLLKWWLLLNLYFVSVSRVLNHNRSFLEFFKTHPSENPLYNNNQIILILMLVILFQNCQVCLHNFPLKNLYLFLYI